MGPDFTKGLLTVVVQSFKSREVLMVAYMNQEAFDASMISGYATFYSRKRQKLWVKGETSGNRLRIVKQRLDCDRDALLLEVNPLGPACHTGQVSCFFKEVT